MTNNWEVKYFKPKNSNQYARLKRTYNGTTLLIFVGSKGWTYKKETGEYGGGYPMGTNGYRDWQAGFGVAEYNVRMSMNGPLMLSISDWNEIKNKIDLIYKTMYAVS